MSTNKAKNLNDSAGAPPASPPPATPHHATTAEALQREGDDRVSAVRKEAEEIRSELNVARKAALHAETEWRNADRAHSAAVEENVQLRAKLAAIADPDELDRATSRVRALELALEQRNTELERERNQTEALALRLNGCISYNEKRAPDPFGADQNAVSRTEGNTISDPAGMVQIGDMRLDIGVPNCPLIVTTAHTKANGIVAVRVARPLVAAQ